MQTPPAFCLIRSGPSDSHDSQKFVNAEARKGRGHNNLRPGLLRQDDEFRVAAGLTAEPMIRHDQR